MPVLITLSLLGALAGCGPSGPLRAHATTSRSPVAPRSGTSATGAAGASVASSVGGSDEEAGLRSAQQAVTAAYFAAIAHPADKAAVGQLLSWYVPGSGGYLAMSRLMGTLATDGFAGRRGPKGYQVIEHVRLEPGGRQGAVTICTFDDSVIYDPRLKDASSQPVVANDDVVSRVSVTYWTRTGNRWRQQVGLEEEQWSGTNHCPAKA